MEDHTPEERLASLVAQYQTPLLRLCYAYLHDLALAEDTVQETFFKAYRSFATFRGDAEEKTWLMRIAMNACRDMRRTAWFRHTDRTVTPDSLPEPSVQPSQRDRAVTLAVMRLPVKLREAVLLYYYQGMSAVETAQALGISQQAVSGRLCRARAKLKDGLEGGLFDE